MTLHPGATKLAGLYLLVMMAISLFFSLNVYQLSVQEFDRGFRHNTGGVFTISGTTAAPAAGAMQQGGALFTQAINTQALDNRLIDDREALFQEARNRIIQRLLIINLLILVGGGILSYYLALRTLKPIEEAQAAQSRFTADASHELRTPITVMRSENEVALMNPKLTLAAAKQQLLSNIEELVKLTDLSEGLLRLASIENAEINNEALKLGSVVKTAVDRVMPLAEKKNILIKTKLEEKLEIVGDETSLVEALVILLDNAIKYSPAKTEVRVDISKKQHRAVVYIIDQGIGIKATELEHIFDRFYRADSSRSKQKVEGYGLGLAIAKNIVELHSGSLSAVSKPDNGSTFVVSLPLKT